MELTNKIAAIPLFTGLPLHQHENLAAIALQKTFKRGQTIFAEGDEGIGFYIILSGRVKIFKLSAEGKEQILHIMESQEPFGEAAVFAGENYPASAQSIVETRLLLFPRQAFVDLISKNPSLALNMLAFLSRRLRKLSSLIEDLSLKEVPVRLAAYLLYLSDRNQGANTLELDISKNQLASLLGTIPETLSRILSRMGKNKLIKSTPHHIHILDHQGLAQLADGRKRLA
jgi:CRP/FNR family transcriptional regulator, dissimilatory nitrate respiration regulator